MPDWHSALQWSHARNAQGIKVVFDIIGEATTGEKEANASTKAYLDLIQSIGRERLYASISVKPSAVGYTWDKSSCLQNLLTIAREASTKKVGFEMDMEGRSLIDFTIESAKVCAAKRYPVTLALQAYQDRTSADLDSALSNGIRVRLVKGAYVGDASDFMDIQGRFKNLARRLIDSGSPFCVGTHDPELIVWTTMKAADFSERVEFGMLKGLSDQTKVDFVKNKWRVSEYVPFGENKAAYESRRKMYLDRLVALGRKPAP